MEGLDTSTLPIDLLLNILNIVILFLIVRTLVYKPVKKFMNARRERIDNESKKAQDTMDEALKIKAEYESKLTDAEEKSKEVIRSGEDDARKKASEILSEAESKSAEIISLARKQGETEKKAALDSMKSDVASLAVEISEKILSREITDRDNKKIAENFFKSGEIK